VTPLNTRWEILSARPAARGLRGRLAGFVWRLVEPVFAEQEASDSALVDHVDRNIGPQREVAKSIASTLATLQHQVHLLCSFNLLLMHYLQRMTPFINAKDYEFDALAKRRFEDLRADLHAHNMALHGLTAGVQG